MMSIGPFTSCKWTAFEILRKSYIKLYLKKENAKLSFAENFLLGGFSGCIAVNNNNLVILFKIDDNYLPIKLNF